MSVQTTVRLEESGYKAAREILGHLGISYSQALNTFNKMIVLRKGIPFPLVLPSETTIQAMHEANSMEGDFTSFENFMRSQ